MVKKHKPGTTELNRRFYNKPSVLKFNYTGGLLFPPCFSEGFLDKVLTGLILCNQSVLIEMQPIISF